MIKQLMAVAAVVGGWYVVKNRINSRSGPGRMSTVTETIEVDVPVSTAYNQWTQFEKFPEFMAGVLNVRQVDDTHLQWRAEIGGKVEEWEAEITEQRPDEVIAWQSSRGVRNGGSVRFEPLSGSRTRIRLRIDYEPRGVIEKIGDAMGAVSLRASGNLERFKRFVETRGVETGAWRGTVNSGQAPSRLSTESAT